MRVAYLCWGLFGVFTCGVNACALAQTNVLWICADDHAAYVCGAYGNAQVRTPAIDQLASQGVRFDRAYCNAPVCTASRQSFLTGRYPRSVGVTQLKTALPEQETTLAELLSAAGYQTAAIGKMHFNSRLTHGFQFRGDVPEHRQWLKSQTRIPIPDAVTVQPPWHPFVDPAATWLNSACLPYAAHAEEMSTTYFVDQSRHWLSQRDQERPFLLMVSFTEPHSPFHFPLEYAGRVDPDEVPVPAVRDEDLPRAPAIFRELDQDQKQGIVAAYYTSVEWLDHNVGRVLALLDEFELADDTLVVYLGDHGYMLGHRGRFEKHCCYEPATRVPLLLRQPGVIPAGKTSDALVELIDVVPTILEQCGVSPPASVQGRSLVAVATGETGSHRDQVFVEYSENEEAAVRDDRWKLIYGTGQRQREDGYTTGLPLPGRTIELYDLDADPDEQNNLANQTEQAERVESMLRQLREHLVATARQPDQIPEGNLFTTLDWCLAPRDVGSDAN